jgi:putative ABC transport system substrate-binding protein
VVLRCTEAQQPPKVPRVGYLGRSPDAPALEPFRQQLRELGWIEGQTLAMEYRWTEGRTERLPELVAELIRLNVDVICTPGSIAAAHAAKHATTTIPIVFTTPADPLATGLVASLARPGGNVTGLGGGIPPPKRLELLKAAVPEGTRVAVLWNPANPSHPPELKDLEEAAQVLGVQLHPVGVREPTELDSAFAAMMSARAHTLLVFGDIMFGQQRARLVELAATSHLPAIYNAKEYVKVGGLMSYEANNTERERRAAVYVDKILRGTKPADLPVEQPTRFELGINLKTAKALGITIPPIILFQADEVIQ